MKVISAAAVIVSVAAQYNCCRSVTGDMEKPTIEYKAIHVPSQCPNAQTKSPRGNTYFDDDCFYVKSRDLKSAPGCCKTVQWKDGSVNYNQRERLNSCYGGPFSDGFPYPWMECSYVKSKKLFKEEEATNGVAEEVEAFEIEN